MVAACWLDRILTSPEREPPNQSLHLTGHAMHGFARFNVLFRVSRQVSLCVRR